MSAYSGLRTNFFQKRVMQESLFFHSQSRRKKDAIGLRFQVTLKKFCSNHTKRLMSKRRVLLLCSEHLFGESLERILRAERDLELIGPWRLEADVCRGIAKVSPDVILIVDADSQNEAIANLSSVIMEAHPKIPIIRAGLRENVVRVHSTQILPARGTDLIETIRNLPLVSALDQ